MALARWAPLIMLKGLQMINYLLGSKMQRSQSIFPSDIDITAPMYNQLDHRKLLISGSMMKNTVFVFIQGIDFFEDSLTFRLSSPPLEQHFHAIDIPISGKLIFRIKWDKIFLRYVMNYLGIIGYVYGLLWIFVIKQPCSYTFDWLKMLKVKKYT